MAFTKAQRIKAKVRIWLSSMSSAGKTYSALRLATGYGGKIAMIDTEAGRGQMYADEFDYDAETITAPFRPEKYVTKIKEAEVGGYECLIIDSMSHEWTQLLEEKGKIDERGGNSFTNWNEPTRRHNALAEAIAQSTIPVIILTCRVKRDWVLTENDRGKMEPKLVGLANIQRDGFEYDMAIEFRLDKNHEAIAIKDNTGIFLNQPPVLLTEEHGKALRDWHNIGVEAPKNTPDCARCDFNGVKKPSTVHVEETGKDLCADCNAAYQRHIAAKIEESEAKAEHDEDDENNYESVTKVA